ncbi:hypothetical protein [Sphingomonas oryzagri]|jgi:hypothetical protein|uniref:Uncharacterized protein n=1 Tax=Sphingomonas oryzagri TaxID=3042314 RepID=A0ABT6MZP6_9SPHN|nr:hypothetical protein [Sphingomonas oryzagri]MDH7637954.1 hypothetical protein [Sphingomonas oryzagri]
MKRTILGLVAAASLTAIVPGIASAAPWQSINGRQANLYNRIEQGVRSGALTRAEAASLRTRFVALERREADYRRSRPGLTIAERADLDRRFNALSASIRVQKHDRQYRR